MIWQYLFWFSTSCLLLALRHIWWQHKQFQLAYEQYSEKYAEIYKAYTEVHKDWTELKEQWKLYFEKEGE